MNVRDLYTKLSSAYGPRGWWPLNKPSVPRAWQQFEIMAGAVLVQNASWVNASRAVQNLVTQGLTDTKVILKVPQPELAQLIRSAGYHNQKAKKLHILAAACEKNAWLHSDADDARPAKTPTRQELLELWGIGPETADCILLYAFEQPEFVVDTYLRRLVSRLGRALSLDCAADAPYDILAQSFMHAIEEQHPRFELPARVRYHGEYHALVVEHAKQHCRAKPLCQDCPFASVCETNAGTRAA